MPETTSTSTAVVTKPAQFSAFMDRFKPQMALALPKHMNADRMARLAVTAFSSSEQLQKCTPISIAGAVLTAAQLGLEIGVNGHAFLVPHNNRRKGITEATLVPGWKGLVDLVSRTGRATAWTGAVFNGDDFEFELGDRPFVRHRPRDETDPAKLVYVYAVGRVNGSEWPVIEVWSMRKVWKHRDRLNKQGDKHYSFRDPEMYARKLPLLQVIKYLPTSPELAAATEAAEAAERGAGFTIDADFVTTTREDDDAPATDTPATEDVQRKSATGSEATSVDEAFGATGAAGDLQQPVGAGPGAVKWLEKRFAAAQLDETAQKATLARHGVTDVATMTAEQFDAVKAELLANS